MSVAQQLYEGVDIKGSGTVGLISYLRTDSTRVSEEAAKAARDYIASNYGETYASAQDSSAKTSGKKIQDAHEAIRPTDIVPDTGDGQGFLDPGAVPSLSAYLEAVCGQPDGRRSL